MEVPALLDLDGHTSAADCTWDEVRSAVTYVQAAQRSLTNLCPNSVVFLGNLVLYLGCTKQGCQQELLALDLSESDPAPRAVLRRDWSAGTGAVSATHQMSKEEKLLRERQRQSTSGITSFSTHGSSSTVLFPMAGKLLMCTPKPGISVGAVAIATPSTAPRMQAKICPNDTNLVSFVRDGDLWISDITRGQEIRLSHARRSCTPGVDAVVREAHSAGTPSYIVQEEFNRYTGYWWQKCSHAVSMDDGDPVHRILYEKVDESNVAILDIPDFSLGGNVESYRFPRPGARNPEVELRLVDIGTEIGPGGSRTIVHRRLPVPLVQLFPWCEYIVRCGWVRDYVWAQLLDRSQNRLSLVLIPVACFEVDEMDGGGPCRDPTVMRDTTALLSQISVILEDTSDVWINVTDILQFLECDADNDVVNFLWATERTGFRHLEVASHSRETQKTTRHPITDGEWQVEDKQVWLDSKRNIVYFSSTKDSPVEIHLYKVRLLDAASITSAIASGHLRWSQPERQTELGMTHQVVMNDDCAAYIDLCSSRTQQTRGVLVRLDVQPESSKSMSAAQVMDYCPASCEWDPRRTIFFEHPAMPIYTPPEPFEFVSEAGHTVYGVVYRPPGAVAEPSCLHPTLLLVYGGPHVQLVTNEYRAVRNIRLNLYALLGYVVVVMDCRGSTRRGLAFEGYLKDKMGTVEIADQVEGLQYLIKTGRYNIDEKRVGIHGWSYGGYLSLMGLAQRPDVFKVAVSGAPVCQWEAYDTAYTERYMSTPSDNPEGYDDGNVLHLVDQFPDHPGRLLIVHGLIDENVHFHHTATFIDAMVAAGKPHQLQIYPNERHGIRGQKAMVHYETTLLWFLHQNL